MLPLVLAVLLLGAQGAELSPTSGAPLSKTDPLHPNSVTPRTEKLPLKTTQNDRSGPYPAIPQGLGIENEVSATLSFCQGIGIVSSATSVDGVRFTVQVDRGASCSDGAACGGGEICAALVEDSPTYCYKVAPPGCVQFKKPRKSDASAPRPFSGGKAHRKQPRQPQELQQPQAPEQPLQPWKLTGLAPLADAVPTAAPILDQLPQQDGSALPARPSETEEGGETETRAEAISSVAALSFASSTRSPPPPMHRNSPPPPKGDVFCTYVKCLARSATGVCTKHKTDCSVTRNTIICSALCTGLARLEKGNDFTCGPVSAPTCPGAVAALERDCAKAADPLTCIAAKIKPGQNG